MFLLYSKRISKGEHVSPRQHVSIVEYVRYNQHIHISYKTAPYVHTLQVSWEETAGALAGECGGGCCVTEHWDTFVTILSSFASSVGPSLFRHGPMATDSD